MSDSKKRDLACNAFFIVLAIVLFILMPYQVSDKNVADFLGPRFFLKVALYIMLGVNLVCLVTRGYAMLGEKSSGAAAEKTGTGPALSFGERVAAIFRREKNVVLILAVVILSSMAMTQIKPIAAKMGITLPGIGFISVGIAMNFVILALLGARKWYYYVIAAACLVGIYVLFYHGFHTMLP